MKILIAVPTSRYIEPDTFKSIYDLDVPEGYEVEFQYFYGYMIDQIRNLIAEWGKRYDYLFCVDADIILPQDTLTKMLAADKDIISGLYIQRIPNTHTLEVYQDAPNGGVENIPYWAIQNMGIIPVAACGFGCVLIKSDVLRKMSYPHFVYRSALDHKHTLSEDVYFCQKARSMGFGIWADVTIQCDHVGSAVFKVDTRSHLEKIAEMDLLPKAHVDYLHSLDIKPKVIYDIGACVQHWTRHAKQKWPNATYYLFDAEPAVAPFLGDPSSYHIGVLSDVDGKKVKFYHSPDNPGGNSYYKETTGAFTEEHAEEFETATLDSISHNRFWLRPDLIKMDVQGAELDILKGAQSCLETCNDVILEAQHTHYNDGAPLATEVIDYMESIGFELVSNFCSHEADGDYHFKRKVEADPANPD